MNMIAPSRRSMHQLIGKPAEELLLLGTGSGLSACPPDYHADLPSRPAKTLPTMGSATGHEVVSYAQRKVNYEWQDDGVHVNFQVCNIDRPIVASSDAIDAGRDVLLTRDYGSHLLCWTPR